MTSVGWIMMRGLVGSALLTVAGFIESPVPSGSWVRHVGSLDAVRRMPHHTALSLVVSMVGLVLLTWAWWDLRVPARDVDAGTRTVRSALALWSVPLLIAPPLFSGDAWSYVATGYMTGHGRSPYTDTPSVLPLAWHSAINGRWQHTHSPYGPLPHVFGGLVSQVVGSPWLMMLAYRAFALLGLALLVWATPRLARRCGQDPGVSSWFVLASPFMLVNAVGGMHLDIVVVGLGAAALVLTRPGRWAAAAVLVGLAASLKIPGGFVAVGVVMLSLDQAATYGARLRRAAQVAAVAGGTLVGLGVVSGLGFGWISALTTQGPLSGRLSVSHDVGWLIDQVFRLTHLDALLGNPDLVTATADLGLAVLVVGAALVTFRQRLGDDASTLRVVALLMVAATVLLPVVHFWYFLLCLPLLACVPLERRWRGMAGGFMVALGLSSIADGALRTHVLVPATTALIIAGTLAGYLAGREPEAVPLSFS